MKRNKFVSNNIKTWKIAFIVFALGLITIVPFYFGEQTEAQTATGTVYVANLTGAPIGEATPRGNAAYFADSSNHTALDVSVMNVNLPFRTVLTVYVDGASVGTFQLSSTKSGRLHLPAPNQPAPTVNDGSTIEVKNGDTVVLAGAFAAPPPPPSPSPSATHTPHPSPSGSPSTSPTPHPTMTPHPTPVAAFFAPLTGETIDGVQPRGMGQYIEFAESKVLNVFVGHVNLAEGTVLTVSVGETAVGDITLDDDGDGRLRLNSANGDTVPTVTEGAAITVKNGETTVVAGVFGLPTPPPTPSPSGTPMGTPTPHPSPSGSPTPNPSPRPVRVFEGRLNGAQVVPAVTTEARGAVKVVLNADETQVKVFAGFRNLSSEQTTATINGPALAGETADMIFELTAVGGTSGHFAVATFDVTSEQVEQLRNGLWYIQIGSTDNPTGEIRGQIRAHSHHSAFTGSETEDIAVFRPNTATWYVSTANGLIARTLGTADSVPVSGDYDGDGKTDFAVFRNGIWTVSRSSDGGLTTKQFGMTGDIPVRGDYDGDGTNDFGVFRPSNGSWYILKSTGGMIATQFGANGDKPVATDLDGDGKTDITVFRPSTGNWYSLKSSSGAFFGVKFGQNGDVPVVGDFDSDGSDDVTVFRASTGAWYSLKSSNGAFQAVAWGKSGDVPVAGNFDGDMTTDIAVFRPSNGTWYILRSSDNAYDFKYFGTNGDVPTPAN
ncbi:MAG TPA: CHRD domain-containing protein [Pyrinomonadaceae bacterium]|nr:CHRD domain-containing protein [Pyrinomonadaceae bacterium]